MPPPTDEDTVLALMRMISADVAGLAIAMGAEDDAVALTDQFLEAALEQLASYGMDVRTRIDSDVD
jgi:hypothetical protein